MAAALSKLDALISLAQTWGKTDNLLDEIAYALSDTQANEIAEYIARAWDIEEEFNRECEALEV